MRWKNQNENRWYRFRDLALKTHFNRLQRSILETLIKSQRSKKMQTPPLDSGGTLHTQEKLKYLPIRLMHNAL